eukprot:11164962-Lingulodinium_polyedra.AAC.1
MKFHAVAEEFYSKGLLGGLGQDKHSIVQMCTILLNYTTFDARSLAKRLPQGALLHGTVGPATVWSCHPVG